MEPTLAIIGLNSRTSPVAVRERFWVGESGRYEALHHLLRSEGIDEAIVLATCNRTEFILWGNDVPAAANSVLRLLAHHYQLKFCDWSHFYRLMDDVAFTHIFQVAAGLDSAVLGELEITTQLQDAPEQARSVGATRRFLDAVVQQALAVSARLRKDTSIGDLTLTFPYAAVELAMRMLGDLSGSEVLLLGAGRMSESPAKCLRNAGDGRLRVMNRTQSKADKLSCTLRQRLNHLCQQEVAFLRQEFGPFTEGSGRSSDHPRVTYYAAHRRPLARELRELTDRTGQDLLTVAVQKLFQSDTPDLIETGQEN